MLSEHRHLQALLLQHGNGLCQIFIQAQRSGNGGSDSRHFQGMGHAGAVVVSLRPQKHLGFVHQAAEGFAVDNPVNIPLITGADILLPFFFKPGDRFVMRPSIGYQEPRGHFLQTTTYFYGEPSGEEENLSFLAASDAEDRLYEKELNGLYLRRTDRLKENPDDTSYVKLLLDAYYNLGLYAALQGDISARGYVEDTDFYFGLARTRNVYNQGGLYTPFYEYEDGSLDDYWNRAYLGSHEIPFRFGLEFNTGFLTVDGHAGVHKANDGAED